MTTADDHERHIEAQALNDARLAEAFDLFRQGALTRVEVLEQHPDLSLTDLLNVQLERGLTTFKIGDETLYATWQFDESGIRKDTPVILSCLKSFNGDAVAIDRVMRLVKYEELDGLTLIEALDNDDRVQQNRAWSILHRVGNGFL